MIHSYVERGVPPGEVGLTINQHTILNSIHRHTVYRCNVFFLLNGMWSYVMLRAIRYRIRLRANNRMIPIRMSGGGGGDHASDKRPCWRLRVKRKRTKETAARSVETESRTRYFGPNTVVV